MLSVFIVAFREFLEAFLTVGVLLGITNKFQLNRTRGIIGAASIGFIVVFILATVIFSADSSVLRHLPKASYALIEGWLFTISSIFVAFAVFSLHKILAHYSQEEVKDIKKKVESYKAAYWLLPFTAFLLVLKEGSEGIFFNITNGLFYSFKEDLAGFGLAFIAAMLCGLLIQKLLVVISLNRIFRITEVFIIIVGVNAITEGLEMLAQYYFHFDISNYDMLIALLYVIFVYEVFIRGDKKKESTVKIVKNEVHLTKRKRTTTKS